MTIAPKAAPRSAALGAFATLLVFTLFGGEFWRDLISWWGYLALGVALLVASVVLLVRLRPRFAWRRFPVSLALFLLLAVASIAWSAYPGASALGVLAQLSTTTVALFLALCLDWAQLLRALGSAFRWLLGLSLVFEAVVAIIIRHPVFPFWVDYHGRKVPQAFYWSRASLLHGGQLQGVLGNSNLLAMVALLALIVFVVQLVDHTVRRSAGWTWIAVALVTLAMTRSSTVIVAALATAVVLGFALWMRRRDPARRTPVYLALLAFIVASIVVIRVFQGTLLELLGKSEDLTGRLGIWSAVSHLAAQRPVFGWGWVSYWAPWVDPFRHLAVRNGVTYLQAHDAWLDVWFQLGFAGLAVFILFVAAALARSWFFAVDRPRSDVHDRQPFTALSLLPLLLLAALLAQSVAESRILVEAGWTVLVVIAVKTRQATP